MILRWNSVILYRYEKGKYEPAEDKGKEVVKIEKLNLNPNGNWQDVRLSVEPPKKGLKPASITNDDYCETVFEFWFRPLLEAAKVCEPRDPERKQEKFGKDDPAYILYFGKKARKEDVDELFCLQSTFIHHIKKIAACDMSVIDCFTTIDRRLYGVRPGLVARVKCLSLVLGKAPEHIFANGSDWPEDFIDRHSQIIEIQGDEAYTLNVKASWDRLYPRTIHNPSEEAKTISIQYRIGDGECRNRIVRIPSGGSILAVFADEDCRTMLSVKGAISLSSPGGRKAFAYIRTGEGLFATGKGIRRPIPLGAGKTVDDGATDGSDGYYYIRGNDLYRGTAVCDLKKPPIRVYGAGHRCFVQFADGTVEGRGKNNTIPPEWEEKKFSALVQDADRGVLFHDGEQAYRWNRSAPESIPEEVFVETMLRCFPQDDPTVCEQVTGSAFTVKYKADGEAEVV